VKLLLAVDGSDSAVRATQEIIETAELYKEAPEVELVTVHLPVPPIGGFSGVVVTRDMIEGYYREEGEKALAPSRQLLDAARIKYTPHILVGDIAPTLVEHAEKSGSQMIYMGTRGRTAIANLVVGSVPTKVLHLAQVPVVLVP
jgi:nucleotide-binding universal stress UspA family protein